MMDEYYLEKLRAQQRDRVALLEAILQVFVTARATSADCSLSIADIAAAIGKPLGIVIQEFEAGVVGDRSLPLLPTCVHWPLTADSRFFAARSFDEVRFYDRALLLMKDHLEMRLAFCHELYERGRLPEAGTDEREPDEGSTR